MRRCGNCGRYPFCEKIINTGSYCNDWIGEENVSSIKNNNGITFNILSIPDNTSD